MKLKTMMTLCALVAAVGCEKTDPDIKPRGTINLSHRPANEALIRGYNLNSIDAAVVRKHTMYPYHFVQHSADFNDLGKREATVLAHHYHKYPGPVNLHQGEESDAVYQARIQTLRSWLLEGGVDSSRIAIAEGLPGGDGLSSDQVVIVLRRMNTAKLSGASAPMADSGDSLSGDSSNTDSSNSDQSNEGAPKR